MRSGSLGYFVYILENAEGKFYVGQTDDLDARVAQHNDPTHNVHKYTTKHAGPWQLVYSEEHPTRAEAMQRERFNKSRKSAAWIRQYLLNR